MVKFVDKKLFTAKRVAELLSLSEENNQYTNNGPVKALLESALEGMLGVGAGKRVVCASSGTAALHALMFLSEKEKKKKWAIPAFTFPSAAVGGMFSVDILDIDLNTFTLPMDPSILQPYDGIIITNLFGTYSNLLEWEALCEKYGKTLVFDNASSPMSSFDGVGICSFGDYSFGSLHHTKYLGVGEGGFAVVRECEYDLFNSILGFGYSDESRVFSATSSNFKMSDISAAYILSHIENYNVDRRVRSQNEIVKRVLDSDGEVMLNAPGVVYGNIPAFFSGNVPDWLEGFECKKYYKPLDSGFARSADVYNRIINVPVGGSDG